MLTEVADGVLVHQSELLQNNTVVVLGPSGALVVDPGITGTELTCLVDDLRQRGVTVALGFSTHPDWDHALWHPALGDVPRYGTVAGAAFLSDLLSAPDWRDQVAEGLPPEIADETPIDLVGHVTALPGTGLPWDGPAIRVIEHPAHSVGHAALLVAGSGVLIAGDMLSDILMPFPDMGADDPLGDYLVGLDALEGVAGEVDVVVPGHGATGADLRHRIALDREYVTALREGRRPDDPRLSPTAAYGSDWLPGVYEWQAETLGPQSTG